MTTGDRNASGDDHDALVVERRFWTEGGGNPEFWREHFADGGLVVLPMGVLDKQATVAAMAGAPPWSSVMMADIEVRVLADGAVAIAYRATGLRDDTEPYEAMVGSVYLAVDGDWQLAFHQQTPIGDA